MLIEVLTQACEGNTFDRGQYLRYCPNNQLVYGLLPEFPLKALKIFAFLRKSCLFLSFSLKKLTITLHCLNCLIDVISMTPVTNTAEYYFQSSVIQPMKTLH